MRPVVRAAFCGFTDPFEGSVPFMYCDVEEYVTIARGNLIDPMALALDLPLLRADGTRATRDEIAAEWQLMKHHARDLAAHGWKWAEKLHTLHLSPDGMNAVTLAKLDQMDAHLHARFPEIWQTLPADAQLGVLSMAWAMGEAFHFPHFETALRTEDFARYDETGDELAPGCCAAECHIDDSEIHGTLTLRNSANVRLFKNAQRVHDLGADPDVLYYPGSPL